MSKGRRSSRGSRRRSVPDVWARAAEYHVLNDHPGATNIESVDWNPLGKDKEYHTIDSAQVWTHFEWDGRRYTALVEIRDVTTMEVEEGVNDTPPWHS